MSNISLTIICAIIGISLPLFITILILVRFIINNAERKKILKIGKSAKGTIISIKQTGMYVNQQPEILINIKVEPEGEPAFEAKIKKIVSLLSIPQIQPGQTVTVKYDPNNHSKIALI